ncbi:hypothetical protein [Desulfopila aestuarii]|uniref:hypothetical protein n=1 Tax=Desulfopila aestuarii TaxID=231440 RepID=UPI001160F0E3|nr:hypothetical protein [Desulfopila aestuarii]
MRRLYFVSRDGQILYKIAKIISEYITTPELHYLYGSRRAWYIPSLQSMPVDQALRSLIGTGKTVHEALILAGLTISEIDLFINKGKSKESDSRISNDLINNLLSNTHFCSVLSKHISESAESAKKYLKQNNLYKTKKWSLVDSGWFLNCQTYLYNILSSTGWKGRVTGFYLGLGGCVPSHKVSGKAYIFFDDRKHSLPLQKYHLLVEHVLLPADHSSVIGYVTTKGIAKPVFHTKNIDPDSAAYANHLHSLALQATRESAESGLLFDKIEAYQNLALTNLTRFLKRPSPSETMALAYLPVQFSHTSTAQCYITTLVTPLNMQTVQKILTQLLRFHKESIRIPWPEGSASILPQPFRYMTLKILSLLRFLQCHITLLFPLAKKHNSNNELNS